MGCSWPKAHAQILCPDLKNSAELFTPLHQVSVVCFLLLNHRSSLHIPDIPDNNTLSHIEFANSFLYSVSCLFTLSTVPFDAHHGDFKGLGSESESGCQ